VANLLTRPVLLTAPLRAPRRTSALRQAGCAGLASLAVVLVAVAIASFSLDAGILFLALAGVPVLVIGALLGRHLDRRLDLLRPGIVFDGRNLRIPLSDGEEACFHLDRPDLEVATGWWSNRFKGTGSGVWRSASEGVHLRLSQGDLDLMLHADDGLFRAWEHGLPNALPREPPDLCLRVWARDLILLAELLSAARSGHRTEELR